MKIVFLGAGSTIFARNVLGDVMLTPSLQNSDIILYDIDALRLEESKIILDAINNTMNQGRANIKTYCGEEHLQEVFIDATFVVNAIQVGGYDPSTIIDFEIPKKYGLKQTIADTVGIGGIMRGLRTIPELEKFARVMERACPDAYFLNYTNPMAILTGYMQRYTKVKTIGLCHSVQVCTRDLFKELDMEEYLEGRKEFIAGINHMAWLLKIEDKNGKDLYPMIKERAKKKNETEKHNDMVRFEYINSFGHYCTESSEHNAEYNQYFIKNKYPELIDKYNIPLDEYIRRCIKQIEDWKLTKEEIIKDSHKEHVRTEEYASYIMDAIVTNGTYQIGASVINTGLITNLPPEACVEVPCLVNGNGIHPTYVGALPFQLAGLNCGNIYSQLMCIDAAITKDREKIYQSVLLDPHASSELSIDDIKSMVDELIEAHGDYMSMY